MTDFLYDDNFPHEHTNERQGYHNGYKPRILRTRVGELNLLVPKDHEGNFLEQLKFKNREGTDSMSHLAC